MIDRCVTASRRSYTFEPARNRAMIAAGSIKVISCCFNDVAGSSEQLIGKNKSCTSSTQSRSSVGANFTVSAVHTHVMLDHLVDAKRVDSTEIRCKYIIVSLCSRMTGTVESQ